MSRRSSPRYQQLAGGSLSCSAAWSSEAGCGLRCGVVSPQARQSGCSLRRQTDLFGEARGLVGDDAPADVARAQLGQQLGNAREKLRLAAHALGVEIEERSRASPCSRGRRALRRTQRAPARARRPRRRGAGARAAAAPVPGPLSMRFTAAARSGAVSASVPSKSKSTARLGVTRGAQQVVHVAVALRGGSAA